MRIFFEKFICKRKKNTYKKLKHVEFHSRDIGLIMGFCIWKMNATLFFFFGKWGISFEMFLLVVNFSPRCFVKLISWHVGKNSGLKLEDCRWKGEEECLVIQSNRPYFFFSNANSVLHVFHLGINSNLLRAPLPLSLAVPYFSPWLIF